MSRTRTLLIAVSLLCAGCDTPTGDAPGSQPPSDGVAEPEDAPDPEPESAPAEPDAGANAIGSATMKQDGTIVLNLRAETGGVVGHGYFEYAPDHPRYAQTLRHLGPMKPGDEQLVPPWPDPPPPTTRYIIFKRGTELGTIAIAGSAMGTLTLATDDEAALELQAMWNEVVAAGEFSVRMHMPTKDGSRGAYGARIYRAHSAEWTEGVHYKLLDEYYNVRVDPPADQ